MALAVISVLALALALAVFHVQAEADLKQCNTATSTSTSVSINNRRNGTGHWISKVDLSQRPSAGSLSNDPAPWLVDVEQRSETCDGQPSLQLVLTFTASPPKPSPGYELYPGVGYYKFHSAVANWSAARKICEEEGAHLVVINSEEEAQVMSFLYKRSKIAHTMRWIWVGVHEQGDRGYYKIFGDTLSSTGFSRWVPSQPDDAAADDCLVYNCPSKGLEDTPCTGSFIYVCEQEIW